MCGINGSSDGDLVQQIHQSIDLKKQVHSEKPGLKSSPSDDDLLEFLASLESMLTKELEDDLSPEIEDVVQPSIENEEGASEEMVMKPQPIVLKLESEQSSPTSAITMEREPPNPIDLSEVDSGQRMAPGVVMMSCMYCYLYVLLASDAELKCPKCGLYGLIDPLLETSGLRGRRN